MDPDPRRRRQVRRSVIILTTIVLALYFGFMVYRVVLVHGLSGAQHPHPGAAQTPISRPVTRP